MTRAILSRLNSRQISIGVLTIACLFCVSLPADDKPDTSKEVKAQKKVEKPSNAAAKISPEREAAVLSFVKINHPELTPLIEGLKANAREEYTAALMDLDRTLDRLEKVKEKTPARYESQLADWKLTSRIRLLAARLAVSKDKPSAESELRAAVVERFEMRLANQRTEAEQLQKRLEKLQATINESSSKKEELIEKELVQLKATRPVAKPATTTAKKAAEPAKSKKAVEPLDVKTGDEK